jgi:hypothetical protein
MPDVELRMTVTERSQIAETDCQDFLRNDCNEANCRHIENCLIVWIKVSFRPKAVEIAYQAVR